MKYNFTLVLFFSLLLTIGAQEHSSMSGSKQYIMRKNNPDVTMDIKFRNLSEPGSYFKANHRGEFRIEVTNVNKFDLYDLTILAKSGAMGDINFDSDYKNIGTLSPGTTEIVEFTIQAGSFVPSGSVQFSFRVQETPTDFVKNETYIVQTGEHLLANILLEKIELNDANLDGHLEDFEDMKISFDLRNNGEGAGYNVKARFVLEKDGQPLQGYIHELNVGTINSKDVQNREIKLPTPNTKNVNLRLTVSENNTNVLNKSYSLDEHFKDELEENIPYTGKVNRDAIAVVIGNSNYEDGDVPDVNYAVRDARMMKEYLVNVMGYSKENVFFVANAKLTNFNEYFGKDKYTPGKLAQVVIPDQSDIFIYYSGHGAPDVNSKTGYLVAVDSKPEQIASTGYSLETLYDNLSRINYRSIVVVIDACFSGFSDGGSLIEGASSLMFEVKDPTLKLKNAAVFTSSSGDEISSWYHDKKHSLFTYYFLKGIQEGERIFNSDELKVADLKNYLRDNVSTQARRLKNRIQTPQVSGDTDMILVKY